jgi:uncharacterized membrane protein YphA (DoxX/SURF4 family)
VKYLTFAGRLLIGGLFVYASFYKIFDPLGFAVSIRNYGILPVEWSNIVALTLPWLEMIAGILLILGLQTKASALLTTGMLGVFLGAIVYAFSIGLDIDCGCFTSAASSPGRVSLYHIVRDSSLFAISLFVLIADRGDLSVSSLVWHVWGHKQIETA